MSSYLSSLTTHYSSLRRLLPTSLSEDADLHVNSENDSHVSRVLRAYYTEKGRPFPAWLGPDPNGPSRPTVPALSSASSVSSAGSLRTGKGPGGATGGGLGDLFADSPSQGGTKDSEPLSLRQRRPGVRSPGFRGGSSDSIPYPPRVTQAPQSQHSLSLSNPARDTPAPQQPNVRLLPSQRAGSYQSRQATASPPSTASIPSTSSNSFSGKDTSVQERLKARLGGTGSRGASPVFGGSSTPPATPPHNNSGDDYDPYSNVNYNSKAGGSFNPYEVSGGSGRNPYTSDDRHSKGGAGKPYMAASSPWVTGEDNYGSSTRNGTRAGSSGSGPGLGDYGHSGQSSLQPGRRGPGLPSSPRRWG